VTNYLAMPETLVRRTQGEIARQQRRHLERAVGIVIGLLAVAIVVALVTPGFVTRSVVESSVGNALTVQVNKCTGPLSAMRCDVQDDSGTAGAYLVRVKGSCWQAQRESDAELETSSSASACIHVHLWENIF
jgi:hypothetical protein